MPPSRTRMLEPAPSVRTGIARSSRVRKYERSRSSAGSNSTCAGPPVLNQDKPAIGALLARDPRRPGIRARSSGVTSGRVEGRALSRERSIAPRFRRELARQRVCPLGDIARAKEDNVIAGLGEGTDERGQILGPFQAERVAVSARLQGADERIAIGACDGRFAR